MCYYFSICKKLLLLYSKKLNKDRYRSILSCRIFFVHFTLCMAQLSNTKVYSFIFHLVHGLAIKSSNLKIIKSKQFTDFLKNLNTNNISLEIAAHIVKY